MQSREIYFPSSLLALFRFEFIILVLCLTGGMQHLAFPQSSNNGINTRLLQQALAGQIRSQVDLANAYLRTNRPEDLPEAMRWYRVAANSGDSFAQTELGVMLEIGAGSIVDLAQARDWYRRAAGEGYLPAVVLLASLYSRGKGVAQDREQALHLLKSAAEQGYAPAKTDLAVLHLLAPDAPAHDIDAVHLLRKAAGRDAKAAFVLGWCYEQGRGVKRDLDEAMRWYTKAAKQGFAAAENNLGFLYSVGVGVPADTVVALRWYCRAAQDGISDATLSIAKLLLSGSGPWRDQHAALVWFAIGKRVGANGITSEAMLDRLMREVSPGEREAIDSEAARWVEQHRSSYPGSLSIDAQLTRFNGSAR